MTIPKPTAEQITNYLNQQKQGRYAAYYGAFFDLHDRKLWHQLTVKLEEFLKNEDFSEGDEVLQLYSNFIVDFDKKINPLTSIQFAVAAAKQLKNVDEAIQFLKSIAEEFKAETEPYVLATMEAASYQLKKGDLPACKKAIEECENLLAALPGVEPVIHASFYKVYADFDELRQNFSGHYKHALLYLACVPLESLSAEDKLRRAHNLAISALLGDSIYNFGELLTHEIIKILEGTQYAWLYDLVSIFNSGRIADFDAHLPQINSSPILTANLQFLIQKLRLMCLIEILFHRSAESRTLPFEVIAKETGLPLDKVEHLIMKAMSLKLIRGVIDDVSLSVDVVWVQPRVLAKNQINDLKERLQNWNGNIAKTIQTLQSETPELFVQ